MLEYSLIKQHQPRFNVRLRDDKSYPFLAVTVDEQWPRALVMRGRKRKGTRYFGPVRPRLRHPRHARRAAALVPDPHVQPVQVQPARAARPAVPAVPHREVQRAVRRRDRRGRRTASSSTSCATSSTATPTPIVKRLDAEMREAATRARVREGGPPARPPGRGAPGDRAPADGRRPQRGHRRHRARRRRARGERSRCSTSAGGGSSGARGSSSTRSRTLTPGGLIDRILEHLYGEDPPQGVPKQVLVPDESEDLDTYEEWLCDAARARGCRSACRSAATSGRCSRRSPATPRRSSPATACGGPATTTPAAGRSPSCRSYLGSARGAAAHRVLRHGPPPGHRLRRLDGRARGRAARTSGSTAGSRSTCPATTTTRRWRRC